MATKTSPSDSKSIDSKVWNLVIIFVGMIVMGIHLALYAYNKHVFNTIVSLYALAFAIVFLVFLYKKKDCMTSLEFNFLVYMSLFVILIEIVVLALTLYSMYAASKSSNSGSSWNSRLR
jgi:asparagine N-glycosylation enzyme membrane subunit Stt3